MTLGQGRKIFDLDLLQEYAMEVGFEVARVSNNCVAVDVGNGFGLCFENTVPANDTVIYFAGSNVHEHSWHSHGDIFRLILEYRDLFARKGNELETVPLVILDGLLDGDILIEAKRYSEGSRYVVSLESGIDPYDVKRLEAGESVILYRPTPGKSNKPKD